MGPMPHKACKAEYGLVIFFSPPKDGGGEYQYAALKVPHSIHFLYFSA